MRGEKNHPSFIARNLPAQRLQKHRLSVGALSEHPQFIHQHLTRLLAGYGVRVCCYDFQAVARSPIRNRPDVVLNVEHGRQLRVGPNHPSCGFECVVSYFTGRRKNQMLFFFTPAQNQRREHDSCRNGGLCVFLADEQSKLADQLLSVLCVIGPKDAAHEVEHPFFAAFSHGWLAGKIGHTQRLENRQGFFRLTGKYGRRNDGLSAYQPVSPVGACRCPFHVYTFWPPAATNLGGAERRNLLAACSARSCTSSFLPPSPRLVCVYCTAAIAARTCKAVASTRPSATSCSSESMSRSAISIGGGGGGLSFLGLPAPGRAPPAFFRGPPLRPGCPAIC